MSTEKPKKAWYCVKCGYELGSNEYPFACKNKVNGKACGCGYWARRSDEKKNPAQV